MTEEEPKRKEKHLLSEIPGTNDTCRPHYSPWDNFPASTGASESRQKINVEKDSLKKST